VETLGFAQVLQFVLSGLTAGGIYGLVALFTLVFNASGIINFAQGQFVMLGGLFGHDVLPPWAGPWPWPCWPPSR
jgi:branched-subunit amino acid ABC-type transport system permease component